MNVLDNKGLIQNILTGPSYPSFPINTMQCIKVITLLWAGHMKSFKSIWRPNSLEGNT